MYIEWGMWCTCTSAHSGVLHVVLDHKQDSTQVYYSMCESILVSEFMRLRNIHVHVSLTKEYNIGNIRDMTLLHTVTHI